MVWCEKARYNPSSDKTDLGGTNLHECCLLGPEVLGLAIAFLLQ